MMILVDVVFPELDKTIDFYLDDQARGWDIAEEIATMAARTCGRQYVPSADVVMLYSVDMQIRLNLNWSLSKNGIHSGARLLLI